jgi:hypothetical protein
MALMIEPGEKLYKIFLTSRESDNSLSASFRAIMFLRASGEIRVVSQFNIGSVGGWEEKTMAVKDTEEMLTEMGKALDASGSKADIYDFTSVSEVDKQLDLAKKVEELSELSMILKARMRWIRI